LIRLFFFSYMSCHGRDRMVVRSTTT